MHLHNVTCNFILRHILNVAFASFRKRTLLQTLSQIFRGQHFSFHRAIWLNLLTTQYMSGFRRCSSCHLIFNLLHLALNCAEKGGGSTLWIAMRILLRCKVASPYPTLGVFQDVAWRRCDRLTLARACCGRPSGACLSAGGLWHAPTLTWLRTNFLYGCEQWWPEWYGCQFGRLRPCFTKPTRLLNLPLPTLSQKSFGAYNRSWRPSEVLGGIVEDGGWKTRAAKVHPPLLCKILCDAYFEYADSCLHEGNTENPVDFQGAGHGSLDELLWSVYSIMRVGYPTTGYPTTAEAKIWKNKKK